MGNKGFTDTNANVETPNDVTFAEKPLKERLIKTNRVDINVLKSKLREKENIAFKKNLLVLISCLAFIAVAGVYATQL
jgi:hypothetical protein